MDVQADANGIIEVDLTQFTKQDLNCICLPWDNTNRGTVWYLLLTGSTTGIETVAAEAAAARAYELSGRLANGKGLQIRNGKVLFVK
jgi:hypothetical protein